MTVLVDEILAHHLNLQQGQTVVRRTLGRGGQASEIAKRLGRRAFLIGSTAIRVISHCVESIEATRRPSASFTQFRRASRGFSGNRITSVDGVLADMGLSTNQLFDQQYWPL